MAVSSKPLELMGVPGSPYTRKMLALLRYRRIPYRLLPTTRHLINPEFDRYPLRPEPRIPLLPTFYLRDENGVEQAVCDTSPVLRSLELCHKERPVIPDNSVLALINSIIEDYADEWLTKAMFHYRWTYQADILKAGEILPRWGNISASEKEISLRSDEIRALQISRLSYVGSNATTGDCIEQSFKRFLSLLDNHLIDMPFILGKRPSSCDFAVFGQLSCLALFDPTPQQLIVENHPRIYAWTEVLEDLSGYETLHGDWLETVSLPQSLQALLKEIGRLYAPYLLANAKAVKEGDELLRMELDGGLWEQSPFPYQVKCLQWIGEEYSSLNQSQKNEIQKLLADSGLLSLFA